MTLVLSSRPKVSNVNPECEMQSQISDPTANATKIPQQTQGENKQRFIAKAGAEQSIPIKQVVVNPAPKRIHIREQKGHFQRIRTGTNTLLVMLFLLVPFINYQGRQAVLFDLAEQQFYIFGTSLWPQDFTLLAWVFIVAAFLLFFVTVFWGRVWCGYLCPQTAWTFIFVWLENKIEGSMNKRHALDKAPWTLNKLTKRIAKHLSWGVVALITGTAFIAYFVPARTLYLEIFTLEASFWVSFWVFLFATCTYLNAGWMREMMCLHCCPYSRFQSAMFDANTKTVTYNAERGENRGPRKRNNQHKRVSLQTKINLNSKNNTTETLGDCVDCNLCVDVCPTGIDIRNGLQYECINCGACVDACNQTMDKFGYAHNLISYTSENRLRGKLDSIWNSGRFLAYGSAIIVMFIIIGVDIINRSEIQLNIIRDRQALYRESDHAGFIENSYQLRIRNKTQQTRHYQISIRGGQDYRLNGNDKVTILAGEQRELPITILSSAQSDSTSIAKLKIQITDLAQPGQRVSQETRFFRP